MRYSITDIAAVTGAEILQQPGTNAVVEQVCIDSRRIIHPAASLFFALETSHRDGHDFISACYKKGVRNFIIHKQTGTYGFDDACFLLVKNTQHALQQLAAYYRKQFHIPVIGITGSNGKTIVKEWLYQLLHTDYQIVRSPKSYNSQVGVPLSVLQMEKEHTLAIFEAGISLPGEMQNLQEIIQPAIGIFTNIGEAHQQGFSNKKEKLHEKLKLFQKANVLIYSPERIGGLQFTPAARQTITWGTSPNCTLQLLKIEKQTVFTQLHLKWQEEIFIISIPFTDAASVDNVITCCCTCLHLGMSITELQQRCAQLKPVQLRLEIKKGNHNTTLVNDSYSADLHSFEIALSLLQQQRQHRHKTIILSDFAELSKAEETAYLALAALIQAHNINRVIAVGDKTRHYLPAALPSAEVICFSTVDELIQQIASVHFRDEAILIKGSRKFELDKLIPLLEQKVHQTVLEINLSAIARNIKAFKQMLQSSTKMMVVVKAFSYGSGSYEIANLLQYVGADYLAVAFADEGVELRKAGITLPVMVMNPETITFDAMVDYNLEPEIFSFSMFDEFESFLEKEGISAYPVHIKIDTGMHRLGFTQYETDELCKRLAAKKRFTVQSVFSHLTGSENEQEDDFTLQQAKEFDLICSKIQSVVPYKFLKHLNNTAGILRHPKLQYDMVRLGIGLYGVTGTSIVNMEESLTLKTTIAQIKHLQPGDTVGYNRKGIITKPSVIATTRIGYADGYPRRLGNGKAFMLVNGQSAPIIGNICMDMTMIDITGIAGVQEGDEVTVFGKDISENQVAQWAGTIAYEIMTGINQRVKRVYYEE
jgi:alanine racemase